MERTGRTSRRRWPSRRPLGRRWWSLPVARRPLSSVLPCLRRLSPTQRATLETHVRGWVTGLPVRHPHHHPLADMLDPIDACAGAWLAVVRGGRHTRPGPGPTANTTFQRNLLPTSTTPMSGLSPPAIAEALRWRYARGTYVFRRVDRAWQNHLPRVDATATVEDGSQTWAYWLLCFRPHRLELWWGGRPVFVEQGGGLWSAEELRGRYADTEAWFVLRPPSERQRANTMDGDVRGIGRHWPQIQEWFRRWVSVNVRNNT